MIKIVKINFRKNIAVNCFKFWVPKKYLQIMDFTVVNHNHQIIMIYPEYMIKKRDKIKVIHKSLF